MAEGQGGLRGHPDVIVEFLCERGVLRIAVRNIGVLPAVAVSVAFSCPLVGLQGARDVGGLALFRHIGFLGPGREISTLLDTAASWFARAQPTRVTALVRFRDREGSDYAAEICHDLEIYRDLAYSPGEADS